MIEVINSGFYSTVQDQGRYGFAHLGVPFSGAMDKASANLANNIVGNNHDEAVIELTIMGGVFRFGCETVISISGADMKPVLNEIPVSHNKRITVKKNDILKFSVARTGCRAYLAVAGGIQSPQILSSRSMFLPVTHCSKLNRGDVLSIKSFEQTPTKYFSKIKNLDFTENELQTYPGPEFENLSSHQKKLLEATKFTISNLNNRMGYQLNELIENSLNPIITSAVLPGTVQLTPGGKLIVLMRDAQTTGGYPRVLQLSDQAINLLAQKKTSDKVTFSMISMNQS
jgi:biotin-dependent carboxylase-like uncharacterized protein